MRIFEEPGDDRLTLSLRGIFDETSCPRIEARMDEIMARDAERIVFDMSGVGYISSTGIRTLIVVHKKCRKNGKRFLLTGMSENVKEILSATGILPLFTEEGGGGPT